MTIGKCLRLQWASLHIGWLGNVEFHLRSKEILIEDPKRKRSESPSTPWFDYVASESIDFVPDTFHSTHFGI